MQKKSGVSLLLIMILWVISVSMAEPSFKVTVSASSAETSFLLQIENPQKKKIRIEISHTNFGRVADTVIGIESYSQRYNMREADDGEYQITVSAGKEKVMKQIEMNTVISRNMTIHD